MEVLHANDAAKLMPRNALCKAVEAVNKAIERAARADKTEVRIDFLADIKGNSCALTPLGEKVVEVFKKHGYTTREIYDCGQFVDIGIALVWPDKPLTSENGAQEAERICRINKKLRGEPDVDCDTSNHDKLTSETGEER